MTQPIGFIDLTKPNYVCQLHKSIYGLKQAPRVWYGALHDELLHLGFSVSHSDHSLFILKNSTTVTLLLIYVDDILITGSSPSLITHIITLLCHKFALKNLGPLHYFLGLDIKRTRHGMFISQTKYAIQLLEQANMLEAKPYSTPISTGQKIGLTSGTILCSSISESIHASTHF